ncbi:hypothetical protein VCV18_005032 [Metarhizium anisopliae]
MPSPAMHLPSGFCLVLEYFGTCNVSSNRGETEQLRQLAVVSDQIGGNLVSDALSLGFFAIGIVTLHVAL